MSDYPEHRQPPEVVAIAAPIFIAEAAVAVALFLGVAITVQGHTLWAAIVGIAG